MKMHRFFLALLGLTASAVQAQFEYVTNDDTIVITGYTGSGGAVVIPSTITGLPVTEIQGSGFEDRGITSVAISETVTNIEAQEFSPNDELISFTVASNNPAYSAIGGVLFNKSGTTLVEYPPGISGSFVIPTNVTTIGPSAFAASYNLSGVTIPEGVTNIGATGFGYCFSLTNVTIPASVTSVGPDTFINCHNLPAIEVAAGSTSFSSMGGVLFDKTGTTLLEYPTGLDGSYAIPSGVTTIGTNAFVLCDGVPDVTFPASVTSIDDGAFSDCSALTNLTLGAGVGYISMSAFAGSDNLLAINVNSSNPNLSSLNGVVFNKNQTTLLLFPTGFTGSYTTPSTVTSIAQNAFEDCKLTEVMITGNVTSLGLDAFQGCGNLTNATMAEGVGIIGIFAFADCPKLATVTIPASVSNLPFGAFANDGLVSVYFEGNEPVTDSSFPGDTATVYYQAGTSGWGPTFDGLTTVLEGAPNPNGALQVTILPDGAVAAGAQWQVDGGLLQPSAATVVGLSVGQHTVSFTTVNGWTTPGNQMVSVNADATNSVSGTYVQQASSATNFTFLTNSGTITITGYIGAGGSVQIPSTITGLPVTAIGQSAFAGVSTFTSVTIADSVTNIGQYAFSSCSSMIDVTISAGVSNITVGTFEDCFSLIEVTFRGDVTNIDDYAFSSCDALRSLTIPDTVMNIGQYAFFGNALTNVMIPASVTRIGVAAFMYCNQLPAILVNAANPAYKSVGGVLYNKNLTEVVDYPDGNLAASYAISNTVTSIGDSAFDYCVLSKITIPNSVTAIGNNSFENCSALAGVILPANLTSIGDAAFAACDGLTGIALPASVTNLGQVPFANCVNMTAITVAAGNPAFSGVNGVLYNKAGTLLVEFPGGEPGSFTIPSGVGDIGMEAFEQTLLTTVVIPGSVTNIEFSGFFNCLNLTSVIMEDGLTTIGPAAFESCYALTNVVLPASLTSIGSSAFGSCSALTTIVLPSGVKSVGDYAFAFNPGFASAYFEGNAPADDRTVFVNDSVAKVYYLPGATGWGSTFGTAPTKELPGIAATVHPSSGYAPLPVSFTAASETSATNPVANWNWDFGDSSTSSTQDPSHTYTAFGHFTASVVETNSQGLPIAGMAMTIVVTPVPIYLGLVENGGFETGDFTGWNLFGGDPSDNFVTNIENETYPYAGGYFAVLGATNLTHLSQTLTTLAGQPYVLSLWLNSPDGLTPNAFQVSWNGTTLLNQSNLLASSGWTNLQFKVSATGTNTVLEFGFLDSPSFLGLDEISVYPVLLDITSVTLSGENLVLDGANGQSGHTYVVLTSTNLALPQNEWTPVATNILSANGNFTITVTNTVSNAISHRFYILETP
jgi:PKD repeat protein